MFNFTLVGLKCSLPVFLDRFDHLQMLLVFLLGLLLVKLILVDRPRCDY